MNIGFLKFGKSIKFKKSTWLSGGGDDEVPNIIIAMAKAYPQHNFVLLGVSDYKKVAYTLPTNISYAFNTTPSDYHGHKFGDKAKWQKDLINRIPKMDAVFCFFGIMGTMSLIDFKQKDDGSGWFKILNSSMRYISQQLYYLQHNDIPWIGIATDPRQISNWKDVDMNPPKALVTQKNITINYNMSSYVNRCRELEMKEITRVWKYAPVETLAVIGGKIAAFDKPPNYNIIMHGTGGREDMIMEYLLDDTKVWGNWKMKGKQFVGTVEPGQIASVLNNTRYTLCIPIADGWMTTKLRSMIMCGVIPFLHHTYGRNSKIPEYLYVKNGKELFAKISKLNADSKKLASLWKDCVKLIPNSMLSGKYQVRMMNKLLRQNCNIDLDS